MSLIHILHPKLEEQAMGGCFQFHLLDGFQEINPVVPLEYQLTAKNIKKAYHDIASTKVLTILSDISNRNHVAKSGVIKLQP